ncbi:MAG: glycosyltransferase family 2 protein [Dokdonella sp.]
MSDQEGSASAMGIESGLTSIVIVAADSGPLLRECVARVLASSGRVEIIVIDNASSDGQPQAVRSSHAGESRLHVQLNSRNVGFGSACNQGAALAAGDALLFLNPDCLIESDTIVRLRRVGESHAEAGLLGVCICEEDGEPAAAIRRRDPSLRRALMSLTGLARFEPFWPALAGVEIPSGAPTRDPELLENVDAVSGACMWMPRLVFDRIGGFDEGYFLHCEDLDLCRRVRDGGNQVLLVNAIRVRHAQGSSSAHRLIEVARSKHQSMWRYFRKFDAAASNALLAAIVFVGIWIHYLLKLPGLWWRTATSVRRSAAQARSPR